MTQQTDAPTHDPFDAAMDPEDISQTVFYGEILFDLYFCALIKGEGKVSFDETQHAPGQRRTAVHVDVIPLFETGASFTIEREFIAEIRTDGWLQVVLPSIQAAGIDNLKDLHESFVRVEMVKYGTYTKNGQEKDLTAPKITAVFDDREACLAAYEAEFGPTKSDDSIEEINEDIFGKTGGSTATSGNNTKPQADGDDPKRRTALQFLPALVRSCRQSDNSIDLEALETKLAETTLVKDYFTIESPEVMAEIEAAMQEAAF